MNAFNRVLLVIMLLGIMVLCSVLMVAPAPVLSLVALWSEGLGRYFGQWEPNSAGWLAQLAVGVLLAAVLDFVLILVIVLEVRKPTRRAMRVERAAGGEVMVSVASIGDRLRYEIDQLPGVLRVRPQVSARRRGVVVRMDVQTVASVDVPEKADRIVELARLVVEEKMGLKLAAAPKVHLSPIPYPRGAVVSVGQAELRPLPADVAPVHRDDEEPPAQET